MQKVDNYKKALGQLAQAVEAYTSSPDDALYRDGLIQRFEFTVELAWKSMKETLEDEGFAPVVGSPKAVLKDAYAAGIIDNQEIWVAILNARNLTSHVYKEETAAGIATAVCARFLPVFQALGAYYDGK